MRQCYIPDCSYFNNFFNHIVKIFQYQFRNIMTSSAKALIIFPNGRGEGSLGSTVVDVGHVAAAAKILTH